MMFDSADIYRNLGVMPVINAQSWVTKLGGSRMRPEVLDSMNKASQLFVDVEDLHYKCSQEIAQMCNADAALITSGCASAIVLMSAAAICKRDESLIEKIPNLNFRPEILIHKGQRNHYDSSFEMTGAKIIEFQSEEQLRQKFSQKTVAIAFVEAPFFDEGLGINKTIKLAGQLNLPVLVDASARIPPLENLYKFINAGATLVSYSGGKGIGGPQNTGFIIGQEDYISLAKRNLICFDTNKATIGRSMKVSKECLVGLTTALKIFLDTDQDLIWKMWKKKSELIVKALSHINGLNVVLEEGVDREGPQAVIYFKDDWLGLRPEEIRKKLIEDTPPIFVGNGGYDQEINIVMVNLQDGEEDIIIERLKVLLTE
jgi:L-seryl-tRNA(Ser) seleniumtransferase